MILLTLTYSHEIADMEWLIQIVIVIKGNDVWVEVRFTRRRRLASRFGCESSKNRVRAVGK